MSRRSRSISCCSSEGEVEGSLASSQLYATSGKMREAAKRAGLAAKLALMKELHALEDGEVKMRHQKEEMELRLQLEDAKAQEEVFQSFCESENPCENEMTNESKPNEDEHEGICANVCKNEPEHQRTNGLERKLHGRPSSSHYATVERPSIDLIRKMQLPTLQLQSFNGDPTKYNNFIRGFEAKIACRVEDDEEKLYYLDQFTAGKPKDIVSSCLHMPPGEGYVEARRLLHERYGNVIQTVAHMIERILSWPSIRAGTDDLDRFAIFLRGTLNALKTMPKGINEIDAKTIRAILRKLNPSINDRWRRLVDRIEHEESRTAKFSDLVKLLEREARISMNPSYGQQYDRRAPASLSSAAMALHEVPSGKSDSSSLTSSNGPCEQCKQEHGICECPEFLRWSLDERRNFAMKHGLCFGCLRKGHLSKNCKNRQTCKKCQGMHPTVLHIEKGTLEGESSAVTSCRLATEQICHMGAKLPVIPVLVKFGDTEIRTNAFLDSGSTHSFCSTALFKKLGAVSRDRVSLKITTVNREKVLSCYVIRGLTMTDEDRNHPLALPPLFTLDRIPVSDADIVQPTDISGWDYLAHTDVTLSNVNEDVGLLLGNDCGYAMEPIEVVPSRDSGPYAIRTRYGWVVGGIRKQRLSAHVNKIILTDVLKTHEALGGGGIKLPPL